MNCLNSDPACSEVMSASLRSSTAIPGGSDPEVLATRLVPRQMGHVAKLPGVVEIRPLPSQAGHGRSCSFCGARRLRLRATSSHQLASPSPNAEDGAPLIRPYLKFPACLRTTVVAVVRLGDVALRQHVMYITIRICLTSMVNLKCQKEEASEL
jgi:hypothetical protein